jgi:hypothetical protein
VPPAPAQPSRRAAAALTGALWLACLAVCWALLATPALDDYTGLMKLTESYGSLERVALWQRTFAWLPGGEPGQAVATWPKPAIVWTVRIALAVMFALQALAFAAAWRAREDRPWRWLAGPIGAQAIMLLMPPSNADVFFYAISGDIANGGHNPYSTHLYDVFRNPLYLYNHWVDMATVYGPVWTLIDRAVMAIAGNDPADAALAFKIVLGLVAIAVAAGTYGTARLLGAGPGRATAAMVLVGWQPNMIVEAAGQAHNDVVMIALALAGVTIVVAGGTRAVRGGAVLVMLSALVKSNSLPLLGLLALTRLANCREPGAGRRIPLAWLLDGVAVLAVAVAAFAPYWTGSSILTEMISEPGRLYTNPIWHVPASLLRAIDAGDGARFEATTRIVAQVAAVIAILVVLARFAIFVWKSAGNGTESGQTAWTRHLLSGWAAIFAILAFVPVNTHAWYWTWPVVPIALLVAFDGDEPDRRWPARRWLLPYLVLTALLTLVYHTRIVHPA